MRRSTLLGAVGVFLWLTTPGLADGRIRITRKGFGPQWPFTVSEGYLSCVTRLVKGKPQQAVLFETNGKRYAVNGWAQELKLGRDVRPIWADDPRLAALGIKKDLRPMIQRGLRIR